MEPTTLTATAIATLVITKAFEKMGEKLGDKALNESGKLLSLLKQKEPDTVRAIESAQQKSLDYGQAYLINKQIDAAVEKYPEIGEAVAAVANAAEPQLTTNFIENWQGINIKGGNNTISNNTLNF